MTNSTKLFSDKDKQHLYKVFQPDEHEYRVMYSVGNDVNHATQNKKVKEWSIYSVYIKRDAIINRLNELFFGEWSSGFLDPQNPCTYHKSHVDCAMHMTIRGVRMEYNGSQSGTGENGAKGAATDAFKRVASQWGIGLYLQHAPTIMTRNPDTLDKQGKKDAEAEVERKIAQWVNGLLRGQPNNVTSLEQPDSTPTPQPTNNERSEVVTDDIMIVGVKQNRNNKYIVADGCTFFSRQVFRDLDYDSEIIDELGKVGMRHLPDPIKIVYVEDTKDNGETYRNPLRVQRVSTKQVVNLESQKVSA